MNPRTPVPLKVSIQSIIHHSGAKVLFGGEPLSTEAAKKIPSVYGAWEPTAVFVPLKEMLKPENFKLCTTEIFGPFQAREYIRGSNNILSLSWTAESTLQNGDFSSFELYLSHEQERESK